MAKAMNLSNLEVREYSCSPEKAVIAAYAQEHGDWNTWDYDSKYSNLLVRGRWSVACGDWCALTRVPSLEEIAAPEGGDGANLEGRCSRAIGAFLDSVGRFRMRIHTGPCNVQEYAEKMRSAGLQVVCEGTEHVYIDAYGIGYINARIRVQDAFKAAGIHLRVP